MPLDFGSPEYLQSLRQGIGGIGQGLLQSQLQRQQQLAQQATPADIEEQQTDIGLKKAKTAWYQKRPEMATKNRELRARLAKTSKKQGLTEADMRQISKDVSLEAQRMMKQELGDYAQFMYSADELSELTVEYENRAMQNYLERRTTIKEEVLGQPKGQQEIRVRDKLTGKTGKFILGPGEKLNSTRYERIK